MFNKIVVAIDNSAMSRQVFAQALDLAASNNARLMLLHVLSAEQEGGPNLPLFPALGYYPGISDRTLELYRQQWQTLEQQGLDLLRSLAAQATAAGVITEFSQTAGSPGRTICDIAASWEANLIIIGRRGLSGLSELFLGSVSNYVLHHAPCSVLTVQGSVIGNQELTQMQATESSSVSQPQ